MVGWLIQPKHLNIVSSRSKLSVLYSIRVEAKERYFLFWKKKKNTIFLGYCVVIGPLLIVLILLAAGTEVSPDKDQRKRGGF